MLDAMKPEKSRQELRDELVVWKTQEARERMELVRSGESGGIQWPRCREHFDFDQASLLYEIELEAERH